MRKYKEKMQIALQIKDNVPVQIKASFWFLISTFLQRGIQFITTPIFTRIMNATEYGQVDIFNSWLDILSVFISLNLSAGVYTRGVVKFEDDRNIFSSSIQGLSFTLIFAWSVVYFLTRFFWNNLFSLHTSQMIMMFLIVWGTSASSFWTTEQRIYYRYKNIITITLIMTVAKPVLGIIFVLIAEDKVTARIIAVAIVDASVGLVLFVEQMNRGKTFFSVKYWSHAVCFNVPLIPHYLSSKVLHSADKIMIGIMDSEATAGIYSLAYSVSLVMTMFNSALMQTLEPWLYKKINEGRIKEISKIAYPAFVLIAGVNILLIAFAPEVVSIFAPDEYYDAIWVIPPVAMSVFFSFSYTFFAVFEFYYEETKYIAFATFIAAALNIFLNYIFIKIFGYYAAGYTTLFCYFAYAVFHYFFMRKVCKKYLQNQQPYDMRIYLLIVGILFLCGFAFLLCYPYPLVRYSMLILLFGVVVLFRKRIEIAIKNLLSVRFNITT